MISILSAIVLMVAIGTVIQRADFLQGVLGTAPKIVLNADEIEAYPNRLSRVEVLKNDEGLSDSDRSALQVVQPPDCGRVFRQGQVLQYLPDATCTGTQIVRYGIQGRNVEYGELRARITGPETTDVARAASDSQAKPDESAASSTVTDQPIQTASTSAQQNAVKDSTPPANDTAATIVETLTQGAATPALAHTDEALARADLPASAEIQPSSSPVTQSEDAVTAAASSQPTMSAEETRALEAAIAASEPVMAPGGGVTVRARALASVETDATTPGQPDATTPGQPDATTTEQTDATTSGQTDAATDTSSQLASLSYDTAIAEPVMPTLAPLRTNDATQSDASAAIDDESSQLASVEVAEAPDLSVLFAGDPSDSGIMVAIVERREPPTTPPTAPNVQRAKDIALPWAPALALPSYETQPERYATIAPSDQILVPSAANELSAALSVVPVDPTQLPLDPQPVKSSEIPPLKPSRFADTNSEDPVQSTAANPALAPAGVRDAPETPLAPSADRVAALPRRDAPCVIPPAMTIDVRRAARSIVTVDAPCHATTVAQLEYSGLRLAIPLDAQGKGDLTVLGFEPSAPALISFDNGEVIDFDLPFKGVDRVSRVALVWELPVNLELNAIEFGSPLLGDDHVRPDNPRSFQDDRRRGGGFLHTYRSYAR
ncbi:MAG: hypothetical protein AAFP68_18270, partial [Pseudomonadota bacterium]